MFWNETHRGPWMQTLISWIIAINLIALALGHSVQARETLVVAKASAKQISQASKESNDSCRRKEEAEAIFNKKIKDTADHIRLGIYSSVIRYSDSVKGASTSATKKEAVDEGIRAGIQAAQNVGNTLDEFDMTPYR